MSEKTVTVVETTPISKCKYCLVGFPDAGLVGSIALSYVVLEQQMLEIGYLESDAFPPVIVVHKGVPQSPFRLYSKDDFVAVLSEIPIEAQLIPSVARSVVEWAHSKNAEIVIALTGTAVQNRVEIDVPKVYGVSSSAAFRDRLDAASIEVFEEGFIAGLHAVMMKECLQKGLPNIILLAQAHLQYPDPGAAASVIAAVSRLVGLQVDATKLLAQADKIRVQTRELMQQTQQQMQQTQKGREQEIPPMYV